jgi:hypothetical protein
VCGTLNVPLEEVALQFEIPLGGATTVELHWPDPEIDLDLRLFDAEAFLKNPDSEPLGISIDKHPERVVETLVAGDPYVVTVEHWEGPVVPEKPLTTFQLLFY